MEHLDPTWSPGEMPHMMSPFSAAADASPIGCGVMISSDDLPLCSHSPSLLDSNPPSSPSNSFEAAVAAVQQAPYEPTLQHVLAHGHGHNTRSIAATSGGSAPPPEGAAPTAAPQAWQQGQAPALQQARRRIGRPIEFTGDIDSPDLDDADRRRLKRRAANRESARRVRQRRQEVLCTTQARLKKLQAQVLGLTARLHQAELHRAQLMQRVAALPAPEQAVTGNRERAALPQQTAIQEQGSAAEAARIGTQAAADGCLPDTPTSGGLLAAEPPGAAGDAGACGRTGSEAVVTSGSLRSGSSNTVVAFAPARASDPNPGRTVTTASSNASSCSVVRLVSSGSNAFLPPPPPSAAKAAAGLAPVLSLTPSTGTTRLTCAAPPLAFPGDWGIPGQGVGYQAPCLPDLFSPGAEEDWLASKTSVDLDALLLPPIDSL